MIISPDNVLYIVLSVGPIAFVKLSWALLVVNGEQRIQIVLMPIRSLFSLW